MSLHLDICLFH